MRDDTKKGKLQKSVSDDKRKEDFNMEDKDLSFEVTTTEKAYKSTTFTAPKTEKQILRR